MLILSRKVDQKIRIGKDIEIMVVKVDGQYVKIGITAPKDVRVDREEIAILRERQNERE